MICVQNSDIGGEHILLTSDLPNTQEAALEVGAWLRAHATNPSPAARPLLVYENGVCVRKWMQAERQPASIATVRQSHYRASFAAWFHLHPPRTV